ncbi:MAG: hypothetical protein ACTTH7_07540 [Treponema sp.]
MNKHDSYTHETIQLRYSREERLKKASETVRRMYEPDYIPRYGIIKGLTATRASRAVLFSIVLCMVLLLFSIFIRIDRTSGSLAGIPVKMETLKQGNVLYVNITFAGNNREDYRQIPIHITVTAYNEKQASLKQEKNIQAIYIGSALTVPIQCTDAGYTRIQAAITSESEHLALRKTITPVQ